MLGVGGAAAPSVGGREARIAFHTALFLAPLSCEGVFSGAVDCFAEKIIFLRASPQTPITTRPML